MDLYLEHNPFDGTQLCASADPELFFPDDEGVYHHVEQAKQICLSCPLTSACLMYALKDPRLQGIWGATTPRERKNLRKRKRVVRS